MRKKRISRTKSIRRNMATRAKFILGRHVELGMVYNGCHFSDGTIEPDAYTTVSYDPKAQEKNAALATTLNSMRSNRRGYYKVA